MGKRRQPGTHCRASSRLGGAVARTHGRRGRPWRRVQARVYAEETHCHLCGKHVDQTLIDYRSAQARSVHHLIPPDIAPELANKRENLRLAHLGCNASAGRGAFEHRGTSRGTPSGPGAQQRATRRGLRTPGYTGYAAGVGVSRRDRDW
jgi:5-methylcytosine-specific restriction endonuclease McrA